ncbi:hypothetical protein BSCH_00610 [Candidatus Paraburkholderia schumanniana]|nr:hypothetical protein BSCH_00610 [Candidatus Paraburkholderia schumannianae]
MRMKRSNLVAAACFATCALSATAQTALPPGHPSSKELMAAEGVMTSAKIARFRNVVHTSYPDAPDFDGEWKLGLAQAQPTVDRFEKLKTSNPAEYQKEIGEACPAIDRGIDEVTGPQK